MLWGTTLVSDVPFAEITHIQDHVDKELTEAIPVTMETPSLSTNLGWWILTTNYPSLPSSSLLYCLCNLFSILLSSCNISTSFHCTVPYSASLLYIQLLSSLSYTSQCNHAISHIHVTFLAFMSVFLCLFT